jgi:hypothetical protein
MKLYLGVYRNTDREVCAAFRAKPFAVFLPEGGGGGGETPGCSKVYLVNKETMGLNISLWVLLYETQVDTVCRLSETSSKL